jgi:hypothetical protein
MFKTRNKSCAGRCRFGHPARKQSPRRRGVGMFRRDKTPLSGALHRFAKGVLKHRPLSGVAAIMSRGIAWLSRLAARGRVLVNVGTGHGTSSRAWLRWRWITPPGSGRSHRINTARPAQTASRTAAPARTARQWWAMGEPVPRLFPRMAGAVQSGRRLGPPGRPWQATDTQHQAKGNPKHGQGHQIGQSMGQGGQKRGGGLYVSE